MGLYFNTATTRTMQEKVNEQFTGTNIDFWKKFPQRKQFQRGAEGRPLHTIASQAGIEPDDSGARARWVQWLKDLERDTGDRMRDIFFEHLDPSAHCRELNFVPILSASMPISIVADPPVSIPGGYALTVYIHTPVAKVVRAAIEKRQDAIAKRRAAKKKKA